MKKITLLVSLFLSAFISILGQSYSEETITFEATEGYTIGDINGQYNWVVTQDSNGEFFLNQVISDEGTLDGTFTLKLSKDPAYSGEVSQLFGALYNYDSPVPNAEADFSADFYISSLQDFSAMSLSFGLVHFDEPTEARFRTYFNFAFGGTTDVLVQGPNPGMIVNLDAGGFTWTSETWYNLRIKTEGIVVTYFIDDVEIFTENLVSDGPIDQLRIAHDNYDGFAYVDNIRTEINRSLSVQDFDMSTVSHFYSKDLDQLVLRSQSDAFSSVSVYNLLGQNVISNKLSHQKETVDFSNLPKGVYVVELNLNERKKSIKVLKH